MQERVKAVPGAAKLLLEFETTKCADYAGSKHLSSSAKPLKATAGPWGASGPGAGGQTPRQRRSDLRRHST